nr:MAG TPA: NTP-PPase-like protein [Caudoviricetes sp.]
MNLRFVTVKSILEWFIRAKPEPTVQNIIQQTAYHFEEVAEMCEALGNQKTADALIEYKEKLLSLTAAECELLWKRADKTALLDALCDQVVTASGVAQYAGMDFDGALTEVNDSNWSKFDDKGNPIINENGKIMKGPNYFKPELEHFVGE